MYGDIGQDSQEKRRNAENFRKNAKPPEQRFYTDEKVIRQLFKEYEGELEASTIKGYQRTLERFADYLKEIGCKYPTEQDVKAYFLERAAQGVSKKSIENNDYRAFLKYGIKVVRHGGKNILYAKGKDYFCGDLPSNEPEEKPKPHGNPYKLIFDTLAEENDAELFIDAMTKIAVIDYPFAPGEKNEALVILAQTIGNILA